MSALRNKKTIKYDDVNWHVGGDFPSDLDASAARTHIGLFLAWAVTRGLESEMLRLLYPEQMQAVVEGRLAGSEVLRQCCDDKLTNDDFLDLGNAFAQAYYESSYLDDYVDLSDDNLPSIYHESDTPEKLLQIQNLLDKRFQEWKADNGLA